MFGFSAAIDPDLSAMKRRLRQLESQLERVGRTGGRKASASLSEDGDQIGPAIAAAISEVIKRFRSSRPWGGEDAMRFGNDAARLGNNALNRLSTEVEHRPLMTLAIAVGVGVLIGIAGRRS
jgi:ElaB/YqjD/DUF883 family membrane-anchored ribosome-binding protein